LAALTAVLSSVASIVSPRYAQPSLDALSKGRAESFEVSLRRVLRIRGTGIKTRLLSMHIACDVGKVARAGGCEKVRQGAMRSGLRSCPTAQAFKYSVQYIASS
jgi:hypothetical protein